jgi:phospholipase/carboxylesterase
MRRSIRAAFGLLLLVATSGVTGYEPDEWNEPAGDVVVRHGRLHGLDFLEVVPKSYDGRTPLPMVVYIHGRGDRPRVPARPLLGEDDPIRLILPRAPESLGDGYTWLPVSARDGESEELVRGLEHASGWLANLIDALTERYPTLGSPIVAGFSQGGMLAFALATHHPEVVGAAFPVAGWLPPSLIPRAPIADRRHPRIRAMHGTDDSTLRIERTRAAVTELQKSGYQVELHEYDVSHRMSAEMWRELRGWLRDEVRARVRAGERARGGVV